MTAKEQLVWIGANLSEVSAILSATHYSLHEFDTSHHKDVVARLIAAMREVRDACEEVQAVNPKRKVTTFNRFNRTI